MLGLCTILFIRKGTCAEIYSQIHMISQQSFSSKYLLSSLALSLFSIGAFADGGPASFLKFSTDFDAKCVVRGGVMIYISNTHSTGKNKSFVGKMVYGQSDCGPGKISPNAGC